MTNQLADEARIVWVDGPHLFPYVCEGAVRTGRQTGPLPWPGLGRLVAYAELREDAPERPGYGHERCIW